MLGFPQHIYIYDAYKEVYQQCEICKERTPAPIRAKVSGLRAYHFGEIIFIDHCDLTVQTADGERVLHFLVILDGASSLHTVYIVPNLEI